MVVRGETCFNGASFGGALGAGVCVTLWEHYSCPHTLSKHTILLSHTVCWSFCIQVNEHTLTPDPIWVPTGEISARLVLLAYDVCKSELVGKWVGAVLGPTDQVASLYRLCAAASLSLKHPTCACLCVWLKVCECVCEHVCMYVGCDSKRN